MLRRLVREEDGVALVIALLAVLVLSSLTGSVLVATAVNHRSAQTSAQADKAFGLAEDGLAYAEGRLYSAATSGEAVLVPTTTFTQDGGSVTYSGTLSGSTWTLHGTGTVDGATRTVSVQATVPPPQTVSDPTIWNYLYADDATNCAATASGNVTINVPIYSQGGLCFNGNVSYTGSDLEVGLDLGLTGNVSIGSHSQPISKMNVHGICPIAQCDGSHSPIWVNSPGVGTTLTPALTMPTIDLPGTYATQQAATESGCPAGFFDNDSTLNNSRGALDPFPSGQSYDCKVGTSELRWDGSKNLLVNGVFLFDGGLSLSGNVSILYSGSGTIYFTGGIATSGNVSVCGVTGTSGNRTCTANWNPNTNGLILAAGCTGVPSGTACVDYEGNTILQLGTYADGDYLSAGNVTDMGPAIAKTLTLKGNTGVMLPFHTLPPGAPTDTRQIDLPPTAPTNWNG